MGEHGARRHRLRLGVAAVAAGVAALVPAPKADAQWSNPGAGTGLVGAQTVMTAATPVAVAAGSDVTVTWLPTALSSGTPVDGYRLARYDATSDEIASLTSCTGLIVTLTCTETGVPTGSWRYRVTAARGAWTGPASAPSGAVTVTSPGPELTALRMLDVDVDGLVDRVVATFDEVLAPYTAGTGPWTLTSPPSGATSSSVTVVGHTATLTLAEGTGAPTTAVDGFRVALAADPAGIRDLTGVAASFAATAPADAAAPVPTAVTTTVAGSAVGRAEAGDAVTFTLSEPLGPDVVLPSTATVTLTDPPGNGNDTIAVPGLLVGARSTGSNGYLSGNNSSATFSGSTLTWSSDRRSVTVVLGSCSGSGCADLATVATPAGLSVLLDPALVDVAGNAPTTTNRTISVRLF